MDVPDLTPAGIFQGHGDDLAVTALVVAHLQQSYGLGLDKAARKGRLLDEHQDVHLIPVLGQGILDVSVIRGVMHGGCREPG